jgi:hypothetical protein
MTRPKHTITLAVGIWLATFAAASAEVPRSAVIQAKNHFGENATVCGVVTSTKYLESKRRSPTLRDLDRSYPISRSRSSSGQRPPEVRETGGRVQGQARVRDGDGDGVSRHPGDRR